MTSRFFLVANEIVLKREDDESRSWLFAYNHDIEHVSSAFVARGGQIEDEKQQVTVPNPSANIAAILYATKGLSASACPKAGLGYSSEGDKERKESKLRVRVARKLRLRRNGKLRDVALRPSFELSPH